MFEFCPLIQSVCRIIFVWSFSVLLGDCCFLLFVRYFQQLYRGYTVGNRVFLVTHYLETESSVFLLVCPFFHQNVLVRLKCLYSNQTSTVSLLKLSLYLLHKHYWHHILLRWGKVKCRKYVKICQKEIMFFVLFKLCSCQELVFYSTSCWTSILKNTFLLTS